MPRRDDTDLALGLRALRDGLIDQASLLAAFEVWEREPAATLVEVLRAHGRLVDADLARLSGDPIGGLTVGQTSETVAYAGPPLPTGNAGAADPPPSRFRILGLHARGGLGEIYAALDTELDRRVALKELQPRYAHDEMSQLRFLQEAEITGRLEHPGVVPVYGLGRHPDGRPFYAMRLVEGETFRAAVDRFHQTGKAARPEERELSFRRLLRSVVEVCFALGYAHSRGVVHRDVKPENIMLGRFGETLLVDWGIAKALDSPEPASPHFAQGSAVKDLPYMTRPGSAIGTPQFMSPEQAEGDPDRIGPASDVYGLGATLYYLLVGRPPFVGDDVEAMLVQVSRGIFPSPRRLRKDIDAGLEAICLRSMSARPLDRYASPLEMADALESWLAAIRYRDEQQEAMEQVRDSQSRLALERASTCFNRGRDGEGMLWLARALEHGPSERDRGIRASLAAWHRRGRNLERTIPQVGEIRTLRFSDDGRRLATATADGVARIWDVSRGTPLGPEMVHPRPIRALEFTRDGRRLFSGCEGGVVRRWDALTSEPLGESNNLGAAVAMLHQSVDGAFRAILDPGVRAWIRDAETGEALADESGPLGFGRRSGLAVGGSRVVVASEAGEVWSWESEDRRWGDRPRLHPAPLTAMAVHPAGDRVLTCCRDGLIRIWGDEDASPFIEQPYHDEIVWAGFSPTGDVIVLVSKFGDGHIRSARDGTMRGEPFVHDGKDAPVAFHPDGSLIATRGRDGLVRLWDVASGLAVGPPLDQGGRVVVLAFSPDGRRLAAGCADGSVRSWKPPEPATGDAERIGLWVRIAVDLDLDAGDVVRPLDSLAGWEMRRRLHELGGPPVK
ncbi:WD40 repeat domain-containing serine/threonine protein kinase [Planctomyces sp. SH-PL62]|uniref:WD40 repeat domain-containing serine/threonine protein kinase n=1 Tax=Planctomyces sp. SH-PL62 TaxID=1636152 RepID=UPI00078D8FCC|nr:serine/threonine-protein kinase [Planctomyces sp. SH-PL62]AMV36654.1 Serine/threonine-protein kinase PknB [Planctomyces sp. SH-PL62]